MVWAEAVSAIALAVIAVVLAVCGVAWLRWLRELERLAGGIERLVTALDLEARPAITSVRSLADDASGIVRTIKAEVDHYRDRSEDVRERVAKLLDGIEDRVRDLEAVIDIVQFEIEESALDFAAALRTTRRSASILKAMKHALFGRR